MLYLGMCRVQWHQLGLNLTWGNGVEIFSRSLYATYSNEKLLGIKGNWESSENRKWPTLIVLEIPLMFFHGETLYG